MNLQFVVEEKERAIDVVKQALEHQRKLSANFSQKFQKELNQRLASQKSEYEAAIHRHQNFIDQVIFSIKTVLNCSIKFVTENFFANNIY